MSGAGAAQKKSASSGPKRGGPPPRSRRRSAADRKPPTLGGAFAHRSSLILYSPSIPIRLLAAAIAMTTALSNPLGATAETTIEIAPMNQQDGAWAGARLGTSPTETIGSAGCAIAAVTMMLRYYGINTDPGAFNAWLTANGGYAFDDQLIWNAVTIYSGGRVSFSGWLGPALGVLEAEL